MHVDRGSVSAWIICNGKIKPSGAGRFRVATNRDDIFADLFEERNMGIMLPDPLLIHYPYRQ